MNTIYYTHRINTGSTAVAALYFDTDTDDLWVEFHNGTVVSRAWRYGIDTLLADLDDCNHSLGTMWNDTLKGLGGRYPATNVEDVEFVDRTTLFVTVDPTEVTSVEENTNVGAGTGGMTVTLDVPELGLLDLDDVSSALTAAGIKHRLSTATAW